MTLIKFPHLDDNVSPADIKAVLAQLNEALDDLEAALSDYAKLNDPAQDIFAAGFHSVVETITAIYSDNISITDTDATNALVQLNMAWLILRANLTDGIKVTPAQIEKTVGSNTTTLAFTTPTANRAITFPDASGVPVLSSSSGALFNIPVSTPGSPVDGDVFRVDNTNTGLKIQVNGVTKTIVLS
jgi:hypothetical protein